MSVALLHTSLLPLGRLSHRSRCRRRRLTPRASTAAVPLSAVELTSTPSKFQWEAQWYPLAPVADLDKRKPHARTVLGRDVVIWWDRNAGEWRVFDDACPHRLAPLSEGRIDPKGRLQCVYHGWCFAGDGACRFIPQAPALGPPVNENPKSFVAVYPCVEQHKIVWFWASSDSQYRDILDRKRPPVIPELDDPSFVCPIGSRDLHYGYEVLTENLMDPAHVPYAHKGIMGGTRKREDEGRVEFDREGGGPLNLKVKETSIDGFVVNLERGFFRFVSPCIFYGGISTEASSEGKTETSIDNRQKQKQALIVFMCIPVNPGRSRVIWAFPRNFAAWLHYLVPRWVDHIRRNLVLDSDLYFLHIEERKLASAGFSNWHKVCYVPTTSDNMVIAFRSWLRLYSNGQVCWANTSSESLPATPPKEQLMDRYWSHVAHCSSCLVALKTLKVLKVALQVTSVAIVGIFAAAKENILASAHARISAVTLAVLCFAISRWLSWFIHKSFYFHDYNHAFK